jgi:hypothetical protein
VTLTKALPITPAIYYELIDRLNSFSPTGTFIQQSAFTITTQTQAGVKYYYATNASQLIYGGTTTAGSVDGTSFPDVYNACVTACGTLGGLINLGVGVFEVDEPLIVNSYITVQGAAVDSALLMYAETLARQCIGKGFRRA